MIILSQTEASFVCSAIINTSTSLKSFVASPRIELGFRTSEILVLTIVRQGYIANLTKLSEQYIYARRNNTLMAAGKNILVGRLRMMRMSSKIVLVLDKNLKMVAALFFSNILLNISLPSIN